MLAFAGRDEGRGRLPAVDTARIISPDAIRKMGAEVERCRSSFDASINDRFCVAMRSGVGLEQMLSGEARRARMLKVRRPGGS